MRSAVPATDAARDAEGLTQSAPECHSPSASKSRKAGRPIRLAPPHRLSKRFSRPLSTRDVPGACSDEQREGTRNQKTRAARHRQRDPHGRTDAASMVAGPRSRGGQDQAPTTSKAGE